jgi:hypothetical protein
MSTVGVLAVTALLLGPWQGVATSPPGPVESTPIGRRIELIEGATLFVPKGYRPSETGVMNVVMHLHGASSVIEPALIDSGWPAVLVVFNRKGLSSVYTGPFSDRTLFPRLMESARAAAKELGLAPEPKVGRVVVSSFSAGFGGVRELLKVPEHFARIDGLVMADSLYCGYAGDPSLRRVDPDLMAGFRKFAAEAAEGCKTFVLTHSAQSPGTYASTTETADDLIKAVGGTAEPSEVAWADGLRQTRKLSRGGFNVLGFSGTEGVDHMKHLRQISRVWRTYRELEAATAPATR